MQTSALSIIDSLKSKLLEFPDLVTRLKNKDYDFLDSLEQWMLETESVLKNNNIKEVSVISGFRSKILTPLFSETQKRSNKKRQLQQAADIMFDLQQTIINVIQPLENKVLEAQDVLSQVLSAVSQSEALKYTDQTVFQDFINNIWNFCSSNDQLKPFTVKVLSLISKNDALRLIADSIILEDWKEK